jgi:glucose/arabinose dehydrogenase
VHRALLPLAVLLTLPGCGSDQPAAPTPPPVAAESGNAHSFDVEPFARGLNRPTWAGMPPGETKKLWVLEQPGRVLELDGAKRTVLLDLTGKVSVGAEQGLLGAAFDPDFAANHLVYLDWTDPKGDTRVAEFEATAHGLEQRRELLYVDQPEENHNGGNLVFGPDGRLYFGLGDGGGAFDPNHNAQDLDTLLGKIIATPVDGEPDWTIVFYGLRNPWRFAFDPAMGEIWIGDVGQDDLEEIDRVQLETDEPPKNLGWHTYEGTERVAGTHGLKGDGELVWPVAQYPHDQGCSVTGGHVYAGTEIAALQQRYLYGDYCTGTIWTLRAAPEGRATDVRRERAKVPQLAHVGTDADGELILVSGAGTLYRAVPAGSR